MQVNWSELSPPPEGIEEYHIAISRRSHCPMEDYQLHVFRFLGDADLWKMAIHIPLLSAPGKLAEYTSENRGTADEAKSEIEAIFVVIAQT